MNTFQKAAAATNKLVLAAMRAPILGNIAGKSMVLITYTGRKSGKTFSLPVSYRQKGNVLLIGVAMPDQKNWWRNFLDDGGRVTVKLRGVDHAGHAVSRRNDDGQVSVKVTLETAAS
ncbi:nitroreductase/quinone reductase family protein [Antrihabitans stalactiti]|uniref:DUF385 domain-containing protein n=1 Tax=Antrihabitans stalactiti TaxID=2584121 RepID=A0A848KJH2_9NOCA|nr:DUF385 domain-containing protein [Antrihabitans stalactiti]